VADRKKMEGHCLTGQSPQWAVVPMDEEEEEEVEEEKVQVTLLPCTVRDTVLRLRKEFKNTRLLLRAAVLAKETFKP